MSTVIISDDMTQPYGEIVTNFLHKISEKGVQKIAMVGMADAADDVIIGYYNMETADKAKAAMHILSDATIEMVAANIDRLLDALNDLPDTEDNQLEIVVEDENGEYKKHFIGLSDNVTYVVEDVTSGDVNQYKYTLNFNPKMWLPEISTIE